MAEEINNPIQANLTRGTDITYSKIISFDVCVDNNDPQRAGRIRVISVKGEGLTQPKINDPVEAIKKLDKEALKNKTYKPWGRGTNGAYGTDPHIVNPFLPLHLNVIPRIGEAVKVITYDTIKDSQNREYVGPIISQFGEIKGDNFANAQIKTSFGAQNVPQPDYAPNGLPICDGKGSFPNPEDVAIVGRDNTDIILGMREKSIIDECDDDPTSSPIPEDWYPQILVRSGKLIKNKEFSSQPKTNKKPTFIQLNTFPQSLTAEEVEVPQSRRDDAPLATLVEWSLDQVALELGNYTGKIEFFKMPYKNDVDSKVFMAGEFHGGTVIPPVAMNVQTNKVCTVDFTNAPSIEELATLINDMIKDIDDADWSSLKKISNNFSTITYNPDVKPDEIGIFLSGMLHPLYFRPNNVTHRLINKPEPVGAPAAYSTMSTNATDLNNLIILDGVKTKGHGLAFTNKAGKRAPEITTEKVKKNILRTEPVQQGIISAGAEKIYLLSYNSTQINGPIKLGGNYGINQEKYAIDIERQTNSLVRGEKLIELLKQIVNVVNNHVHEMPGYPRVEYPLSKKDLKITVDNADEIILNKNIRIN